jgi:hypothetical protein
MTVLVNLMVLCCLYYVSVTASQEASLWMYGIAQILLYGSHLVFLRWAGQQDLLEALNILNLGLFLHFTPAPFLLYYGIMPPLYHELWDGNDFSEALLLTQTLCVLTQVGYYLDIFHKPSPPVLDVPTSEGKFVGAILVLVVLWYSADLLPPSLSESGLYTSMTSLIFYLTYVLIIMRPSQIALPTTVLVVIGLLCSLYISLFSGHGGSKAGVANLPLAYVLYRHYFISRISLLHAAIAVALGVVMVSFMNYTRAVGYLLNISMDTANPLQEDNWAAFAAAGLSATLTPFEAFMVVLNTFPGMLPYQDGQRLLEDMVYPLFPRFLFPAKPEVYGASFYWDYRMNFLSLEAKTFEAISLPGHFYLDFGVSGLVACGLLIGMIHRYVYKRLVCDGVTKGSICLYGILSAHFVISARGFFWTTYPIIAFIVIPYLFLRFLCQRRRQRGSLLSSRPRGQLHRELGGCPEASA